MKKFLKLGGFIAPFTARDADENETVVVEDDVAVKIAEAYEAGEVLTDDLSKTAPLSEAEPIMRAAAKTSKYAKSKGIMQTDPSKPTEEQKADAAAVKSLITKHGSVQKAVVAHDAEIEALKKPPVKESDKAALYRAVKTLVEADIRMAGESRPTLTNMTKKVVESGKYNFDQRIEAAEVVIKELLA